MRCAVAVLAGLALLAPTTSHAQPATDPDAEEQDPIEVVVEGDRADTGQVRFGRREIREMPGVLGDPLRTLEIAPGVTPIATGIPFYFVRGSPPGTLGTYYEGVSVPLLFHVGAGPGVLPPSLVSAVDLHMGPYPVSFGRVAGGVLDVQATEPVVERWRGEASFRVIDLGGFLEGPVSEDVSLLVGGRGSVGTGLISALVPQVDLGYADYQSRLTIARGPRERITVLTFGAYDFLASPDSTFDEVLLDSDFHRLDVRWDRRSSGGTATRLGATLGLDRSRGQGVDSAHAHKIGMRGSVTHPADDLLLRAGFDLAIDVFDTEFEPTTCERISCTEQQLEQQRAALASSSEGQLQLAFRQMFRDRTDLAVGGFADVVIPFGDRTTITPGLRLDHYTSLGESALAVDPRLLTRFAVTKYFRLLPAAGIASQPPGFPPLPGMVIGGLPGGLQRAVQTSFGAEVDVGPLDVRSTLFRQATLDMNDPIGSERGGGFGTSRFLSRSLGDAYGLELSVVGPIHKNLYLYGSYTLSRALRHRLGETLPSAYDRTHVLHAALLYDLGAGVRAGVRQVFYSGFPADELNPYRERAESPERTLPFYRLDVRFSKRWSLGDTSWASLAIDLQNATLSQETFDVECGAERCRSRRMGPVTIPTLALDVGF